MNALSSLRNRIRLHGSIMLRRWYLVVVTLLCMAPLLYMAHEATGVYYTSVNLLFLPPPASVGGNSLRADPARTVYFAAVVERRFNGEDAALGLRSTDAPLYGTGIRSGHAVYLPNAGGQWQTNFNKPAIAIEVVGQSAAGVQQDLAAMTARIQVLARQPQVEMGIHPDSFITTELSPAVPNVTYVGVRNKKALAALGLLTVGMAIGVPQVGDRIIRAIGRRRARRSDAKERGGRTAPSAVETTV